MHFLKALLGVLGFLSLGGGATGIYLLSNSSSQNNSSNKVISAEDPTKESAYEWELILKQGSDKKKYCGKQGEMKFNTDNDCSTDWPQKISKEEEKNTDGVWMRVKSKESTSLSQKGDFLDKWNLVIENYKNTCNMIKEDNGWIELDCQSK